MTDSPESTVKPETTGSGGARGRPTKYDPEMCDRVVAMGEKGYLSKRAMCADLGINFDTLAEWVSKYPDFSVAMDRQPSFHKLIGNTCHDVAPAPVRC